MIRFAQTIMLESEKKTLETAILTIADPNGNWDYGWKLICDLVEMDPATYKPHFAETELRSTMRKQGAEKSAKGIS